MANETTAYAEALMRELDSASVIAAAKRGEIFLSLLEQQNGLEQKSKPKKQKKLKLKGMEVDI